jgi:hypothetical protein
MGAYLTACFCSFNRYRAQTRNSERFPQLDRTVGASTLFIGGYLVIFALLPSLFITYAEGASVRSVPGNVLGGPLVGIASYCLYTLLLIIGAGTAEGFFGMSRDGS